MPVAEANLRELLRAVLVYSREQVEHALTEANTRIRAVYRLDLALDRELTGQDLVNFRRVALAQLPNLNFLTRNNLGAWAETVPIEHLLFMLVDDVLSPEERVSAGVVWFRLHGVEVTR